MSSRRAAHLIQQPEASTALVEAFLALSEIDVLGGAWRTMDDVARIIHSIYRLPSTTKLTTEFIWCELSKDPCTISAVDSWSINSTGIFRDKYMQREQSTGVRRVRCLFLCKAGNFPPKPPPG